MDWKQEAVPDDSKADKRDGIMTCGDGLVVAAALLGFVLLAIAIEREVG